MAVVEAKLVTFAETIVSVGSRLDQLAVRLAGFESATASVDMRKETAASFKEVRDQARSDFRLVFGALVAVALDLAGLMASGFHWL